LFNVYLPIFAPHHEPQRPKRSIEGFIANPKRGSAIPRFAIRALEAFPENPTLLQNI